MELKINNTKEIESFELTYSPVTLDVYYNQFRRDLSIDYSDCMRTYGQLSRSLSIRLIWAMCVTSNAGFMPFIEFIDCLEYKIYDFIEIWGKDFMNWFMPIIDVDYTK